MGHTIRVLLVEDNPGDAELAREYIEETGHRVDIVTIDDGQLAIDFFKDVGKNMLTFGYVTILVFSSLFKAKEVTSIVIWQAISVYLLIGLTWASLFTFVEIMVPGSLNDTSSSGGPLAYSTIVYYSFVTLATLGYGDIVPTTSITRGLAVLEVLTGVLFMH